MPNLCSIEGCGRPHYGRGWCNTHYRRWQRNGDPLAARPYGDAAAFVDRAIQHKGTDCLIWPYSVASHGYGQVSYRGRNCPVHQILCEAMHGKKPSSIHEVAHTCGVRTCCNPRHLRWDTHRGNAADMIRHDTTRRGERAHFAKLTDDMVHAIRAQPQRPEADLAAEFGVSRVTVCRVRAKTTWRHV